MATVAEEEDPTTMSQNKQKKKNLSPASRRIQTLFEEYLEGHPKNHQKNGNNKNEEQVIVEGLVLLQRQGTSGISYITRGEEEDVWSEPASLQALGIHTDSACNNFLVHAFERDTYYDDEEEDPLVLVKAKDASYLEQEEEEEYSLLSPKKKNDAYDQKMANHSRVQEQAIDALSMSLMSWGAPNLVLEEGEEEKLSEPLDRKTTKEDSKQEDVDPDVPVQNVIVVTTTAMQPTNKKTPDKCFVPESQGYTFENQWWITTQFLNDANCLGGSTKGTCGW